MADLKIPAEGLFLRHDSRASSPNHSPSQVIQLDLAEDLTKDILRSLRNNEPVRLRCGKKPAVQLAKKTIPLESTSSRFPSDLYQPRSASDNSLYFSGKLSHTLEVQKAEEDTAGSDEALAALESTLKSIQEQRASNETSIIGSKDPGKGKKDNKVSPLLGQNSSLRKEHLISGLARSTPSSPFLSATYSPRLGPTSAPLAAGLSTKDQVRLDAIRVPLIHLLAIRPLTLRGVAEKLRAPRDEVAKILDKVARDTNVGDGRKELKEKSYRELNVYKFNYRTPEDRQAAIANAITAYDRIRVDKKDTLWQLLLPENERGKGRCLSKLNFDKPVPAPSQANTRQGDDGNESKTELSDREPSKVKAKKEASTTQKKAKERAGPPKPTNKADIGVTARSKDISNNKQPKSDGKFKSSERIEDSDEEAEAADDLVVKPKPRTTVTASAPPTGSGSGVTSASKVKRRADQEQTKASTPSHIISPPKKTVHKTSLSGSSSSSSSGNEKSRPIVGDTSRSLKPHSRPEPPTSASRISPRPRHDSSPQKPSPLGSSPPTTSTDVDNSGSSKSSNQSSAPSSPPSSTDMPKAKQQNGNKYSPVISSDKSGNVSRSRSPVRGKVDQADDSRVPKRKVETAPEDDRPTKRQQQNPPSVQAHHKSLSNGTTPNSSANVQRPPPKRKNSGSNSSRASSPEKPGPKREDVIQDARRFQKYYRRYKELYDRISSVDEKDRDDKTMGDLWKMHTRLKEMKADIWGNWDRVEKVERVNESMDKPLRQAMAAG